MDEKQAAAAKKVNRHVVIALRHMNKRRYALMEQRDRLVEEIKELDTAILALDRDTQSVVGA